MESNQLTLICLEAFRYLPHLKELDLSHNLLEQLDPHIFKGTYRIEHINLWKNELNQLDVATFNDLDKLKDLDLSRNKLTKLNAKMFVGLKRLEKIYLHGNEFESDTIQLQLEKSVKFVSFKKHYQQNDIKSVTLCLRET